MFELARATRAALLDHASEGAPEEVCGVLGGVVEEESIRATTHVPVENVARTPETRYELDPAAQLAAMERIEDEGRAVVGFYHSHPRGPTGPSATDAAQATWPGMRYVIVVPDESFVGCWLWDGEAFERET
ncbi:desampylase [Halomarina ordinaria]|uniref:Desampylase n=1 Tax=Halomarina ordinaria TaxID=3033939 RepID=A0ABD5UBE2_9EURY|nr:desampylase [Halomarina sp. PSRA2]